MTPEAKRVKKYIEKANRVLIGNDIGRGEGWKDRYIEVAKMIQSEHLHKQKKGKK